MKVTKSVKRRHQGLMAEIEKEILSSEKFLEGHLEDHERLRL